MDTIEKNATPLISTLNVEVCGELNNLSLAAAIYDWYRNKLRPYNYERVDIGIVADLLKIQAEHDYTRGRIAKMEADFRHE